MKKIISLALVFVSLLSLVACGQEDDGQIDVKGQDYFNAEVLEVSENYILVECQDVTSGGVSEGSQVTVSLDVVVANGAPEIAVGDEIRVVFSGVMESYPLKLQTVFAIYQLDEEGNVIISE